MYTISVHTTQNVVIQYPVASAGERVLAYVIDRIILVFYLLTVIALGSFLSKDFDATFTWFWIVLVAFPFVFFSLVFEIFMDGQTPGKKAMHIQVVRLDGTRASVGDFIFRWIFAFVDFAIFGGIVALIVVIAGGKGQRLGDVVAGTSVIKLTQQKEVSAEEIFITAEDNYTPTFAQAIQLTAADVELMQRALEVEKQYGNAEPLEMLIEKIKSRLGIQSELPSEVFVHTLIKDYSHLTSR